MMAATSNPRPATGKSVVAIVTGLALVAGPTLASAYDCQPRQACGATRSEDAGRNPERARQGESKGCCCHEQEMPSGCAMDCADGYAGVHRFEASPLRITHSPLRKSLASLSVAPPATVPLVVPMRELRARRSPTVFHPPKRYLLACTFRL